MDEVAAQVVQASGSALACILGSADRSTHLVTRVLGGHGLPAGFRETLQEAWHVSGTLVVSNSLRTRNTQVIELSRMAPLPGYDAVREAQAQAGWAIMAVVPMVYRGEALGLVIAPYPAGNPPDAAEISFLEAISDQAAVGLENARLFEQAQATAVVEERQRISRELHDSVSQALYGISLGAQTARELLDTDPARAAEPIDYVTSLAEAGLAEMRALIFELRPDALATEGLVSALVRQADVMRTRHHIEVATEFAGEPDIAIEAKEMLYRIAQEALQNVLKHARATEVQLRLVADDAGLLLEVHDNGRGFEVGGSYPGRLGLTSMRERAGRAGAALDIMSGPGGSIVRVALEAT